MHSLILYKAEKYHFLSIAQFKAFSYWKLVEQFIVHVWKILLGSLIVVWDRVKFIF